MGLGLIALAIASAFTGAAFYINFAEHPARMGLETDAALKQWHAAYSRGALMQAGLAMLGGIFALAAAITADWRWAIGGVVLAANWPYTLMIIMPLNKRLMAVQAEDSAEAARAMLDRWNLLHAARTAIGALAVALLIWAAL
jgi:hypothetical protein